MAIFVVEFQYNVDRAGREPFHPAHAQYLAQLAERGVLLLGGPLVGTNGGLLVYAAENRTELQKVLDGEPYIQGGLVDEIRIREWKPGKGSWINNPPASI